MVDMIEGHPIPQDITGFQFRLIGDMTVKQFAYLAAGLVIGWFFFILPFPLVIKIIVASFPVLIGLIFAFVPVQGIPADTLLLLFFKALLKPNQYIYEKTGKDFTTDNTKQIPSATEKKGGKDKIKVEKMPIPASQPVILLNSEKPALPPVPQVKTTPVQTPPIISTQTASQTVQPPAKPDDTDNIFKKQLEDALNQKKLLEQQLQDLQKKTLQPAPSQAVQSSSPPSFPLGFKKITDQPKKGIAPFMPDVPNLIAGVVKDPRGNVLPNILVEVKDKDDNPVRAFKTNQLGQFASATPLVNGTYTITFEDSKKQQRFDTIELSAAGEILPPLEITSIDEREELRKSLFTT